MTIQLAHPNHLVSRETLLTKSSPATDTEKAWYALCGTCKFISNDAVKRFSERLRAEGKHAAIVVGLSHFTAQSCPRCTESGQFKVPLLGRLIHPACGWTGYVETGSYIGHQLKQVVHVGMRAAGGMKEGADRKDDAGGAWVNGIFGFFFGSVLRAQLALLLIPVHATVALFQPGPNWSPALRAHPRSHHRSERAWIRNPPGIWNLELIQSSFGPEFGATALPGAGDEKCCQPCKQVPPFSQTKFQLR